MAFKRDNHTVYSVINKLVAVHLVTGIEYYGSCLGWLLLELTA